MPARFKKFSQGEDALAKMAQHEKTMWVEKPKRKTSGD